MPAPPFPIEEIRRQSRKSQEIENATYAGSTGDYEQSFREGCDLFDRAARQTNRFRRIDGTALYQDQVVISVLRHLLKPYVALDRLGQLAGLSKGAVQRIEGGGLGEREQFEAIAGIINRYLDRERLPWLDHTISKSEEDRAFEWARRWTASSYANITARKVQRMSVSAIQEDAIAMAIESAGWTEARSAPALISRAQDVPPGSYTREKRIKCIPPPNKKADSVTRLDAARLLLLEAKHNIDELNARKRIAEVRDKATKWRQSLGPRKVVVGAVLSGYFPEDEVRSLWDDGILIFWKHDIAELARWIRENGSRS